MRAVQGSKLTWTVDCPQTVPDCNIYSPECLKFCPQMVILHINCFMVAFSLSQLHPNNESSSSRGEFLQWLGRCLFWVLLSPVLLYILNGDRWNFFDWPHDITVTWWQWKFELLEKVRAASPQRYQLEFLEKPVTIPNCHYIRWAYRPLDFSDRPCICHHCGDWYRYLQNLSKPLVPEFNLVTVYTSYDLKPSKCHSHSADSWLYSETCLERPLLWDTIHLERPDVPW